MDSLILSTAWSLLKWWVPGVSTTCVEEVHGFVQVFRIMHSTHPGTEKRRTPRKHRLVGCIWQHTSSSIQSNHVVCLNALP
ncbi:hypothetical protein EDC04DRAFT_553903 [Pisolithus marmoratus]|nr:hypothetical protein EDC04DRAFT_553903 [Pisolithus marmoratus]